MSIDWWTLGLQAVNVLVLIWLLSRFLFRPVAAIIAERQQAATAALEEATTARTVAQAEVAQAKAEAAKLAAARADMFKAAEAEAEKEKAALLQAARAEADKARDAARAEIDRMRSAEAAEAADRASTLATDIAARLLARLPDGARVTGFIDGLAEAVAALPDATRAGIDTPLHLRAPRALTEAEAQTCRERLSAALDRPVEIEVEVDAALLAGLELTALHAIVRNSFQADLAAIAAELTRHDR